MSSSTFNAFDGDGYELQMGRWSRRLAPAFLAFAGVQAGAKVLDVGCGTGVLSFALAAHPAIEAIQGVDFAPAYVAHAARNNRDPAFSSRSATPPPWTSPMRRSITRCRCWCCSSCLASTLPSAKCG